MATTDPAKVTPADPPGGPEREEEKRRGLRKMKLVALSFLIGATVIFALRTIQHPAAQDSSAFDGVASGTTPYRVFFKDGVFRGAP